MKKHLKIVLIIGIAAFLLAVGGVAALHFKLLDKTLTASASDDGAHKENREERENTTGAPSEHASYDHVNGFDQMPPVGTKAFCPVMQNDFTVDKETSSSVYQGKTYVFCCPMCKPTFDKNPEPYLALLEKQPAAPSASPAADGLTTDESSAARAVAKSGERKIKYWVAPMDPKFIADKPGKSPMGMDLVPVYEDDSSAASGKGGQVVAIDPVMVQNMGVRVAKVEHGPIFRHVRTIGEVGKRASTYFSYISSPRPALAVSCSIVFFKTRGNSTVCSMRI